MTAAGLTVEALPPGALGGSALAEGVRRRDPAALAFYRWGRSQSDREEAARVAAEAATARGTRDAVADVLAEQNRAWVASDAALALVDDLRQPDAVAVVTGQQLGLFAGPLYTIHKAVSAVRLAERLAVETGRPVVPVFWLADEDHDFAEIHRAAFARGEDVRFCTYDDGRDARADRGAVGRIVLEEGATTRALAELAEALPDGPHRAEALALARDAYVPGRTMRDAFARLLRALVPDVVLMSADDVRLKTIAAPLFRREARDWHLTRAALDERTAALVAAGFHGQIDPSPVNLFLLEDGARVPLDPSEGGFALRGTGRTLSAGDLLARVDRQPETVSPNVVLRPLVQDTLLPTAATVAGPGEAAYFAQLAPVYDLFGVPMPLVEPRLSLTVVEPGVAKVLDRYDVRVPDLGRDADALWRRLALAESGLDLDGAFADAERRADALFAALAPLVTAVDAALDTAVGAARQRTLNALGRLETQTVRLEKRNHDVVRARLARARAALWPGAPQERVLGPLGVVARHGVGGLRAILDAVPLDGAAHHVVRT